MSLDAREPARLRLTPGAPIADPADEEALRDEVRQAMELVKAHGFHPYLPLCQPDEHGRRDCGVFAVIRAKPGECVELIAFRGLEAQGIRAQEINLIIPDFDGGSAGTNVITGWALYVATQMLGEPYGGIACSDSKPIDH